MAAVWSALEARLRRLLRVNLAVLNVARLDTMTVFQEKPVVAGLTLDGGRVHLGTIGHGRLETGPGTFDEEEVGLALETSQFYQ